MQKKIQATSSINQILEMFKAYNNDISNPKKIDYQKSTQQHYESSDGIADSSPFSFTLEELRVGSSLEKIQKDRNKQPLTSTRQGMSTSLNDSYNKNIFQRLYEENKNVKQKRERLIQQGRRSLEAKEIKECTFSPNVHLKLKTERSCNADDIEAFYQKNMNWQSKKQEQIKRKQCEKNNQDKNCLTFAPQINSSFKRERENKENHKQPQSHLAQPQSHLAQPQSHLAQPQSHSTQPQSHLTQPQSHLTQPQSYLTIYQRHAQRQLEVNSKKSAYKSIWNNKKGYFSYAR